MKIIFELDTNNINDIQLATMRRTIDRAKHAHFTNVELRINGENETEQADWLKHFIEVPNEKVNSAGGDLSASPATERSES